MWRQGLFFLRLLEITISQATSCQNWREEKKKEKKTLKSCKIQFDNDIEDMGSLLSVTLKLHLPTHSLNKRKKNNAFTGQNRQQSSGF